MIGQTANQRIDAGGLPLDVIACALVARENREELHRQHGGCGRERLDDGFVGDRRSGDPFQVGQAAPDGVLAVPVERRIGNDEPMQQIDTHVWLPRNISGSTADRADFNEATAEFIPPVGGIPRPFVSLVEVRDTNDTDVPFVRTRISTVASLYPRPFFGSEEKSIG